MIARRLHLITLMAALFSWPAYGAEFEIHPTLIVSEEYTDNVFETYYGRVGDFITRTRPGISMALKSPRLDGNVRYFYDYRYYARGTHGTDDTHDLNASAHLTAVENLLFLDVADNYKRVSLDVSKNVSQESLFVNQTDQNTLNVSPYMTLHPGPRTMVKSGYRYLDTRYIDSTGIDKTDHVGFVDVTHELTSKWSATGGYSFTREESSADSYRHQGYGGFRYEYAEKSFLFGQVGNTWIDFDNGRNLSELFWNAGFSHILGLYTITANTGVKYSEDPLHNVTQETFANAAIEKAIPNGNLGLSLDYAEYLLTETDVVDTRRYGLGLRGKYAFTQDFDGTLNFIAERYDKETQNSYSRRFVVDSALNYIAGKYVTLSLNHVFVDSYSPDIFTDNYVINRIIFEVKLAF